MNYAWVRKNTWKTASNLLVILNIKYFLCFIEIFFLEFSFSTPDEEIDLLAYLNANKLSSFQFETQEHHRAKKGIRHSGLLNNICVTFSNYGSITVVILHQPLGKLFFDNSLKDVMEKHLLNDTKTTKDQPLLINEDATIANTKNIKLKIQGKGAKVQHIY
jgi:hypothetical protein